MQEGTFSLKIIHLITDLDTGGAEMMLVKLLSHMDSERFTNVVISLTDRGTLGDCIDALGVPILTLGMRHGLPDPRGIGRLVKLLRQEKPDILQTWLYHADLLGTISARLARVPVLCWNIRCSDMDMRHYSRLSRLVLQILARLSRQPDVVIVNSQAGRQLHEERGYSPRRWETIPNGFDLERFRPNPNAYQALRAELALLPHTLLIGLIARYDPMKDQRMFLQAARQLIDERDDVHFVLAGKDIDLLSGMVDAMELGLYVHLLGERGDIPNLMAALDVLSLSSAFGEGFPNVVGEAMACGVPCVVTDVGDTANIVGETGFVVPPRDPGKMADTWQHLLAMSVEERQALGQSARRRVEKLFSIQAVVRRYEVLYRGIAGDCERS
ncbi:MAG: glycosyltransferase [Anaerolineae bacterium]|nr:glycosyltransferase [Anaerolineae bacterium]